MFGILTTENIEQAGTKAGNKSYDCAVGAIEMVNFIEMVKPAEIDVEFLGVDVVFSKQWLD